MDIEKHACVPCPKGNPLPKQIRLRTKASYEIFQLPAGKNSSNHPADNSSQFFFVFSANVVV